MTNEDKIKKVTEYLRERISVYNEFMDTNIRNKGERVSPGDFDSLTLSLLNGYSSEKEIAEHVLNILEKG